MSTKTPAQILEESVAKEKLFIQKLHALMEEFKVEIEDNGYNGESSYVFTGKNFYVPIWQIFP